MKHLLFILQLLAFSLGLHAQPWTFPPLAAASPASSYSLTTDPNVFYLWQASSLPAYSDGLTFSNWPGTPTAGPRAPIAETNSTANGSTYYPVYVKNWNFSGQPGAFFDGVNRFLTNAGGPWAGIRPPYSFILAYQFLGKCVTNITPTGPLAPIGWNGRDSGMTETLILFSDLNDNSTNDITLYTSRSDNYCHSGLTNIDNAPHILIGVNNSTATTASLKLAQDNSVFYPMTGYQNQNSWNTTNNNAAFAMEVDNGSLRHQCNLIMGVYAVATNDVSSYAPEIFAALSNQFIAPITSGVADYQTGMIDRWNVREGSGSTLFDTGSGANNMTTHNSPIWVTGGFTNEISGISNTLNFEGSSTSQYAVSGNITLGNTFTVACWVNAATTANGTRILETRYNQGFALTEDTTGTHYRFDVNNTSSYTNAPVGGNVVPGLWTHVAGVYDGTTAWLYVNGALVSSGTQTPPGSVTLPVYMATFLASGSYLSGYIRDARIYNTALTANQVSNVWASSTNRY